MLIEEIVIEEENKTNFDQPNIRTKETLYEKERAKCFELWDKIKLLKGLPEEIKGDVAVLLENQRLYNHHIKDNPDIGRFKRISVPLVRRICGTALWNFISIQPMLGPASIIHYFKNNKIVDEDIGSVIHKMKTFWNCDPNQVVGLNAEAELLVIMAQELALEFERRIIHNMVNVAALKKSIDFGNLSGDTIGAKGAALQEMIFDIAMESKTIYHRPMPNWIITSYEVASMICPRMQNDTFMGYLGIHKYGSLSTDHGDIAVWVDALFAPGKVLIGYKGEHAFDAGYIWAPYVLVSQSPAILDPDSFIQRKGILSRFGQKLVDPAYYSTLAITNFIL